MHQQADRRAGRVLSYYCSWIHVILDRKQRARRQDTPGSYVKRLKERLEEKDGFERRNAELSNLCWSEYVLIHDRHFLLEFNTDNEGA